MPTVTVLGRALAINKKAGIQYVEPEVLLNYQDSALLAAALECIPTVSTPVPCCPENHLDGLIAFAQKVNAVATRLLTDGNEMFVLESDLPEGVFEQVRQNRQAENTPIFAKSVGDYEKMHKAAYLVPYKLPNNAAEALASLSEKDLQAVVHELIAACYAAEVSVHRVNDLIALLPSTDVNELKCVASDIEQFGVSKWLDEHFSQCAENVDFFSHRPEIRSALNRTLNDVRLAQRIWELLTN